MALTPLRAIAKHCFECGGRSYKERENCEHIECPLYPYRFGHRPKVQAKYTPIKAIQRFCMECVGEVGYKANYKERELCPNKKCYLYPFRLGKNPNFKKHRVVKESVIA